MTITEGASVHARQCTRNIDGGEDAPSESLSHLLQARKRSDISLIELGTSNDVRLEQS